MRRFCIFAGVTLFSALGWWLGSKVGFMTGYFAGGLGALAGVYFGWRVWRDYLA